MPTKASRQPLQSPFFEEKMVIAHVLLQHEEKSLAFEERLDLSNEIINNADVTIKGVVQSVQYFLRDSVLYSKIVLNTDHIFRGDEKEYSPQATIIRKARPDEGVVFENGRIELLG